MLLKPFFTLSFLLIGAIVFISLYSCKKENSFTKAPADTTVVRIPIPDLPVTDIDGNTYRTVKIGSQVWMAEPLRATHYNDNSMIPYIIKGSEWDTITTGARCYWGINVGELGTTDESISDSAKYAVPFGALYNWAAVHSGKLAPAGYHVPSARDFDTLINYLGGPSIAGQFLKSTHYWNDDKDSTKPNRNNTGLTALPGGYRADWPSAGTNYYGFGRASFFWSSTENSATTAIFYRLSYANASTFHNDFSNFYGMSVICVKN